MADENNRRETDLTQYERIAHVEKEVVSLAGILHSQGESIAEVKELLRRLTNRPVNVVGWVTAGMSLLGAIGAGTFIMVQYINLEQQPLIERIQSTEEFNLRVMDSLVEQAESRGRAVAERKYQQDIQDEIKMRLLALERPDVHRGDL